MLTYLPKDQAAVGERIVDFAGSNLHVVSCSTPVHSTKSLVELKGHLHTLPDHPDWIPYLTSYYKPYRDCRFSRIKPTVDATWEIQ